MPPQKQDIIAQLQRDILSLQGLRPLPGGMTVDLGLGPIQSAFPNASFPTAAVHEFLIEGAEGAAATEGFVSGLLSGLLGRGGACVWIGTERTLFPSALKLFDLSPDRFIFVDLQREKDVRWAIEEALKCEVLTAVVGEIREIDFTASRRLQLAVEQSRVTGFLLRDRPRNLTTTATVSRWKISPLASETEDELPGIGFPRWQVELLRIRNGHPGQWQIEWTPAGFRQLDNVIAQSALVQTASLQKRKTG